MDKLKVIIIIVSGNFKSRDLSEVPSSLPLLPGPLSFVVVVMEERNKMLEEFILKACKSFQRCVFIIIEKGKWLPY